MSQVEQVRAAADIVKIVGDYVKLRKSGANFVGLCPFHQEKTASFAVHPTKQIFHCFGCGVGGDVFKFVMMIENLSFPEALRRVAEKVGITIRDRQGGAEMDERGRERTGLYKLHELAAKFYAAQLGATAEGRAARGYLADRGLNDETVAEFRLGYAPAGGQALVSHLTDLGFSPETAEKSGLVLRAAESGRRFDRFRRRIIFPIANESGKVVAFGGRALGDEPPKYLNSPETPIYTKGRVLYHLDRASNAIRKLDYAILVEGYMDTIAVASAGIENVVATCGTSLTEGQIRLLARYTRRVVVNYDPDSAGVAATQRSLDLLLESGLKPAVLELPDGLDPDSLVRHGGAGEYAGRLRRAPNYVYYLIDKAIQKHGIENPEQKAATANAVLPYIAKVPDNIERQAYAVRLMERLQIMDATFRRQLLLQAGAGRQTYNVPEHVQPTQATPAEKKLLRAFFDDDEMAGEFLPKLVSSGACEGLAAEGVFRRLSELHAAGERLEVPRIEEWLDAPGQRLAYESVMEGGEAPSREVVEGCLRSLKMAHGLRERERLQAEILAAERDGRTGILNELRDAKTKIDKELRGLAGA
jgi:DNA primase